MKKVLLFSSSIFLVGSLLAVCGSENTTKDEAQQSQSAETVPTAADFSKEQQQYKEFALGRLKRLKLHRI